MILFEVSRRFLCFDCPSLFLSASDRSWSDPCCWGGSFKHMYGLINLKKDCAWSHRFQSKPMHGSHILNKDPMYGLCPCMLNWRKRGVPLHSEIVVQYRVLQTHMIFIWERGRGVAPGCTPFWSLSVKSDGWSKPLRYHFPRYDFRKGCGPSPIIDGRERESYRTFWNEMWGQTRHAWTSQ